MSNPNVIDIGDFKQRRDAEHINEQWKSYVSKCVDVGLMLLEAEMELSPRDFKKVVAELSMPPAKARRLMKIATHPNPSAACELMIRKENLK